jgi:alanyl-tRNA synthetase
MTDKIYYTDSYQTSFTSIVEEQKTTPEGTWIKFPATIFYPGGGGQLPDKGLINEADLDLVKEDAGEIWHLVKNGNEMIVDSEVSLKLDWDWRYYNMQQHSGQHLISHVLWEHHLKTVSVHLGESYTLIEVEGTYPDDKMIQTVENETNQLIRDARPMKAYWVDRETIDKLPLRKPAGDWDNLRIVEIEGLDYSACGGTHVRNTAEIGLVKCVGTEKIRGHARLKFVIGPRAYEYLNQLHDINTDLKLNLQTDPDQFITKIDSLRAELSEKKKETEFYRNEFIISQSNRLASEYSDSDQPVVIEVRDGIYDDWKHIAKLLANDNNKLVFIVFENRFVLTAPEHHSFNTVDFMKQFGPELKLKGGGPQGFVQGSLESANMENVKTAISNYINIL